MYEFIRACFYAEAADHPRVQVFGILVTEIIALVTITRIHPFEATRLNALMVYILGFSKIVSVALCAAFDPHFGLSRIMTTVIGTVIIVIQGLLTILLMVAILSGAISSYISVTRDQDMESFKPRSWRPLRQKYLSHVENAASDLQRQPDSHSHSHELSEQPREPSLNVVTVKRYPKIEDDDDQLLYPFHTYDSFCAGPSRSVSGQSWTTSSNLPLGARVVRPSWSFQDLGRESSTR